MLQTVAGGCIGVAGTLAGIGFKTLIDASASRRKSEVIRRDLKLALSSLQHPMRAAAGRGMADPEKWVPLIARIESRMSSVESLGAIDDEQALIVEELLREARVALLHIRVSAAATLKRLETESPPLENEYTRLGAAINGVTYDPRMTDFREVVKREGRVVDALITRARVSFNDRSGLIGDETYTYPARLAKPSIRDLMFPKVRRYGSCQVV